MRVEMHLPASCLILLAWIPQHLDSSSPPVSRLGRRRSIAEAAASFQNLIHQIVGSRGRTAPIGEFTASLSDLSRNARSSRLRQPPVHYGDQFLLLVRGKLICRFQNFSEWQDMSHDAVP